MQARPLVALVLLGVPVAVLHVFHIHRSRPFGTFDIDEAGYLASALRIGRNLSDSGLGGVGRVLPTQTGPLVPLLSQPFLAVHARSVLAAMVLLPLLHVVSAVAVGGIVRRLAGPVHALVAGVVVLGLPVMLVEARIYQFSVAAGCALALAVWALLASERGTRWAPMVGLGAAVGAMVLARTMTVAFLPGLAVAAAWEFRWDRRTWGRVGAAAAAALVVAGWWWVPNVGPATDYLRSSGYSAVAGQFGPVGIPGRLDAHWWIMVRSVRPLLLLAVLVVVVGWVLGWRSRSASLRSWARSPEGRPFVACAAVAALGYLALLSSANNTDGFDVPVLLVAVALIVASTRWIPPRLRRVSATMALVVAVANVAAIGVVTWGSGTVATADGRPESAASFLLFAGPEIHDANLAALDDRFRWDRPRAERDAAAAAWWRANVEAARALGRLEQQIPGGTVRTVVGSSASVAANSLLLAEEVDDLPHAPLTDVDAGLPVERFLDLAQPTRDGKRNVLVLIEPRTDLADTPGRSAEVAALRRVLVGKGWRVGDRIALPDGGAVRVLVRG